MPKTVKSAQKTPARLLFKRTAYVQKKGKWYPAEVGPLKDSAKKAAKPAIAKLRKSLTPGTIVILLSGRFRGKRAVFLKQLESGLLLITGPYNVNGVPLRRVNQAYVIATKEKVDVAGVNTAAVNDAFFAKDKTPIAKGEEAFFAAKQAKAAGPSDEKKKVQAAVDAAFKLDDVRKAYLRSTFSLSRGDKPHEMTF